MRWFPVAFHAHQVSIACRDLSYNELTGSVEVFGKLIKLTLLYVEQDVLVSVEAVHWLNVTVS